MALRPPGPPTSARLPESGADILDYEIAAEKAASLGRAAERVDSALVRLRSHRGDAEERAVLVKEAADAVYGYFIQREFCGLRRHDDIIREHRIPGEVIARLGAS